MYSKRPGTYTEDPNLRAFFRHINAVGGALRGSDQEKARMRREIYSMIPLLGPPTFFFTINPADVFNPIAAYFAGADVKIGLSDPDKTRMPDFFKRAWMVARDPVAAAKFFHTVVQAFIRCILGSDPDVREVPLDKRLGCIGDIFAHYAHSESQNRGTLHLHGLAWHAGGMCASRLAAKMNDVGPDGKDFRLRLLRFWDDVIRETGADGPFSGL